MAILRTMIGFVLVGITMEVFWTSILNSIKTRNPRLTGETYLWMFPTYHDVETDSVLKYKKQQ